MERVAILVLLLLYAPVACSNREDRPPVAPREPVPSPPAAVDADWTVGGPGAPATGPGERCEQLTGTCEPYCAGDDIGPPMEGPPSLSGEQVVQLGAIVLRQTLAARATWVLLDPTSRGGAPAVEAEVLRRLKQQYRIFGSEQELPGEYLRRQGTWVGYEHGYRFRYQLDFLTSSRVRIWIKVTYGNWGCDFYYKVFKWEGAEWRTACVSPMSDAC